VVCLEASYKEQGVKLILLDEVSDKLHARLRWQFAVCSNFRATLAGPAVHLQPVERSDGTLRLIGVVAGEPSETVVNSNRLVSSAETVRNGGANGGIHTTCRCADI
jgi:hypothetical protein